MRHYAGLRMGIATEGARPLRRACGHGTAATRVVWLGLLAAVMLTLFTQSALAAGPVLSSCGTHLTRGRVWVPIDPSGRVPGSVGLFVVRYARTPNPSGGTVMALAGGPGQSAVDLLPGFADDLAPVLRDRALVVFDARGVGRSGALKCPSPGRDAGDAWVTGCANSLGPRRSFYSTANSVADIEAVRKALGIQHMALEGVSYGTYTALAYARAHPALVDRLVLDSALPADGNPTFKLSSVAAMRRVLGNL